LKVPKPKGRKDLEDFTDTFCNKPNGPKNSTACKSSKKRQDKNNRCHPANVEFKQAFPLRKISL
jgi:hypothetical protein